MIIKWFDQVPLKEDIEIVGVQVTAIAHRTALIPSSL